MNRQTPHAPTLNGIPHMRRAEAILYVFLVYIFNYIHPRYQAYIDALAAHDRLSEICDRAEHLQTRFGLCPAPQQYRSLWRDTDLPDIYFALIFAWRRVPSRIWSNLRFPPLSNQIFPSIEPD